MAKYLNSEDDWAKILDMLGEISAKVDALCDKIAPEKPTENEDEIDKEPEIKWEETDEPETNTEETSEVETDEPEKTEKPETEDEETEEEDKDDTKGNNPFMNFLKTISK